MIFPWNRKSELITAFYSNIKTHFFQYISLFNIIHIGTDHVIWVKEKWIFTPCYWIMKIVQAFFSVQMDHIGGGGKGEYRDPPSFQSFFQPPGIIASVFLEQPARGIHENRSR